MSGPTVSYAQRFEDLYLMSCFADRRRGFYVDIGSGHPVYDNTSFAFYLRGWSGVTVEPNPWLARLSKAVRPRDLHLQTLVGAAPGETTFFLVRDLHGFSTAIESHARAAHARFGKSSQPLTMPVTTLSELCQAHVPTSFEFLKMDVEGAETEVLLSGDWHKFRPKVLVAEALAPYTLAPAWQEWEPFLSRYGYRYVLFDSLNRYYVAEEASELAERLKAAPPAFEGVVQFRNIKAALDDEAHPDRHLATIIARAAMIRLPLSDPAGLCELLTCDLTAADLEQPADANAIAGIAERVFGTRSAAECIDKLNLPAGARVRDVYGALVETDQFRAACGRISASYAW